MSRARSWGLPLTVALAALGLIAAFAIRAAVTRSPEERRAALVPPRGQVAFGVQLDWTTDTPPAYAHRLGHAPAIVGEYYDFPDDEAGRDQLRRHADQAGRIGAAYMLTVMPVEGLDAIDRRAAEEFADLVRDLAGRTSILVRFAHEMNGPWYAWGQQPAAYVRTFRRVSRALRDRAPAAAMVWAPNDGSGYPFSGWDHSAKPGTPDFAALDTDRDGRLTTADDPYAPYYPGDEYVDWVGITLYHFGRRWPWSENEVPGPAKFAGTLTGAGYAGAAAEAVLPDFYADYAAARGKPMLIGETSALYLPGTGGASNVAIKSAWWRQLFRADLPRRFPLLRGILWFEHDKEELGAQARVDWTVTRDAQVRRAFVRDLPDWLRFAGEDGDP